MSRPLHRRPDRPPAPHLRPPALPLALRLPALSPAASLPLLAATGDLRDWLAQPTVAFLLLVVGTASLLVEASNPGIVGTGVFGLLCVLGGLYSLTLQDVRVSGLVLVVLALVLYAVEVLAAGTMVAAVAGTLALAAGGLLLIEGGGGVPAVVVLPVALLSGGAAVLGGRFALRTRHLPSRLTGGDQLVGRVVTVVASTADELPRAFTDGAWWSLRRADGGPLRPHTTVVVTGVDGLTLVVEPAPGGDGDPSPPGAP